VVGCLIPSEKFEVAAFIIINWGAPATNLEELHYPVKEIQYISIGREV